jgi:hypothetical protein
MLCHDVCMKRVKVFFRVFVTIKVSLNHAECEGTDAISSSDFQPMRKYPFQSATLKFCASFVSFSSSMDLRISNVSIVLNTTSIPSAVADELSLVFAMSNIGALWSNYQNAVLTSQCHTELCIKVFESRV